MNKPNLMDVADRDPSKLGLITISVPLFMEMLHRYFTLPPDFECHMVLGQENTNNLLTQKIMVKGYSSTFQPVGHGFNIPEVFVTNTDAYQSKNVYAQKGNAHQLLIKPEFSQAIVELIEMKYGKQL